MGDTTPHNDYVIEHTKEAAYERIKQLCFEHGISIASLSRQIGMSEGFLYTFRQSKALVSYGYLQAISDVLGMSYEETFGDYFNPSPTAEEIEELSRLLNMVFEDDAGDS